MVTDAGQPLPTALRLVRTHWLFLLVILAGLGVRGVAWLGITPAWWFFGDSLEYVFGSFHLQAGDWRPSGYSLLFLEPMRVVLHSLAAVTAVQHLMGLATGALVYAAALRLGARHWLAVAASIPVLFDGYLIASEQMLVSEPLFNLLVAAAAAALLWQPAQPAVRMAGAAGFLLGLATVTRAIGLPLLVVALAFLAWRRSRPVLYAALVAAFLIPVGPYVARVYTMYHRVNLTVSTGIFLYGRVTQYVDCPRFDAGHPDLAALCPKEPPGGRNELFYVFDQASPISLAAPEKAPANDLAGRFAVAAIKDQPGAYLEVVWRDLQSEFGTGPEGDVSAVRFKVDEQMKPEATQLGSAYQRSDPGPYYRPPLVRAMATYQDLVWLPGLACLAVLLLAAAAFILGRGPRARMLRSAILLSAGSAFVMLVAPAFTVAPDPRYRLPALSMLGLAAVAALTLLMSRGTQPAEITDSPPM